MTEYLTHLIQKHPRSSCLISGILSSLIFAPFFAFPLIMTLGILAYHTQKATNAKDAFVYGIYFGFGHFITGLYWVTYAILVYADDFWWAIPFALLGLPLLMSFFTGALSVIANLCTGAPMFNLVFSILWVIFEWLRSWILTGFPWNLIGYCFSITTPLIQSASIWGVLGLSMIGTYIGTSATYFLINKNLTIFKRHIIIGSLIITSLYIFGEYRLKKFPTQLSNTTVRLIQPNIEQQDKWDSELFFDSLEKHIQLSLEQTKIEPEIIIWSESAIPTFIENKHLLKILSSFLKPNQILISGAIGQDATKHERYVGMYAINNQGQIIFEYNKMHLVPFGEYMPFKEVLSVKKLTHDVVDYSKGKANQKNTLLALKIKPIICYEAIFYDLVKTSNQENDLIINITNDSWYGNSPGPYQHFYMTQMRAVENGLPLLRTAGGGISAIIDPLGRILERTKLNATTYLNHQIPVKLKEQTTYSSYFQLLILFTLAVFLSIVELINLRHSRS